NDCADCAGRRSANYSRQLPGVPFFGYNRATRTALTPVRRTAVMAFASVADLAAVLRQGRFLEPAHQEQLDQVAAKNSDPRTLGRELVRLGWLTPFQVNQLFLGRADSLTLGSYILLDKLGEGGMGVVYKARHQKLGRIVAIKIVRKEHLAKAEAVRR